ncbi:MAG: peroxide stress protein YaaA, partial [Lachnospiraceae bacterium]
MRIILSPAKKMNENQDIIDPLGIPEYVNQTQEILLWLRSQTREDLQKMWKCNDKIAQQNFERLEQ